MGHKTRTFNKNSRLYHILQRTFKKLTVEGLDVCVADFVCCWPLCVCVCVCVLVESGPTHKVTEFLPLCVCFAFVHICVYVCVFAFGPHVASMTLNVPLDRSHCFAVLVKGGIL